MAQIATSILEFGFVAPVLVDEARRGHRWPRPAAGREVLGLDTVPTIVRRPLHDAQKAAYRLADNRIALNAGWDEALLAAEVAKLQEIGGVDLALTGFDGAEIERLLAGLETETGNLAAPAVASVAEPRLATRPWIGIQGPPRIPPTRTPIHRARRSPAPATFGCSASTACSAATALMPRASRG